MSAVGMTLAEITAEVHEVVVSKGFRPAEGGPGTNTWGDYVALLHSEVAEALEAYRDHRLADATTTTVHGTPLHGREKPQGVGSELADVLIRLVDMADVWDLLLLGRDEQNGPVQISAITLADVEIFADIYYRTPHSFGDWMAWLHFRIAEMDIGRAYATPFVLRALVTTARHFGIDLEAEYRRKIAYNRTRPYQHGGRTLADDPRLATSGGKTMRLKRLMDAMPTDPRGWWTGDDVGAFVNVWEMLDLPGLTMQYAEGDRLVLWCTDVRLAAALVDMAENVVADRGFEIVVGEYVIGIVQAEKKETKDA